ncbi:MAG: diol dehydratase small subunit, partial [Pseudomonadota bacterium]
SGLAFDDLTVEAAVGERLNMSDIGITSEALRSQAEIARRAGRATLAENLERGAELVAVPDEVIFEIYELLRPGRSRNREALDAAAARLRREHHAHKIADFIQEAAAVYEKRGLFSRRF